MSLFLKNSIITSTSCWGRGDIRLLRLTPPPITTTFLHRNNNKLSTSSFLRRRRRRSWKMLKTNRLLVVRSSSSDSQLSSSSPIENYLLNTFVSQLDLIPPTVLSFGFTTSALAATIILLLYNSPTTRLHNNNQIENENEIVGGEWSLFTSPTPFNRFLILRCASLLHSNIEKEEEPQGHLTGPILSIKLQQEEELVSSYYQRTCVNTDDGGVLSLDWPSHLHHDLSNQHNNGLLDTTILIIPGTTDGSMDHNVTSFVHQCFNRGCFPVVMNPRGCARSPLTTPRLFTAADSDDIATSVQFINRARPWTTFMAVGFGYGANMLTKYLSEVGEDTPLTAAVCLDNPFDFKHPPTNCLYSHLTPGLIHILQSNKELFQGPSKGYDVGKALQAESLNDFEEAISMVSYGFDSLEEFHVSSGTRDVVGNVKIPLLFIQDDAVTSSSIPHSSIAENPFTSLLICKFRSDGKSITGTSAVSWCQHLVVEWLTAVELGLLKGRHPLLEDTDVTINASKHSKLMASRASDASNRSNNLLNLHQLDSSSGNASYPFQKMQSSDGNVYSSSSIELQNSKAKNEDVNGIVTQTNLLGSEVVKEGDVDLVDTETGQVVRATDVVINMLDVTMPGSLSEEQKHKVLTAVAQGETLMNALQEAVPEDVRGKLTNAATAILQNQKKNFGVPSISNAPVITSTLNTKMHERSGPSSQELEPNASVLNNGDASSAADSNNHPTMNDASEPEAHTLGTGESSQIQSTSYHDGENSNSATKSNDELGSDNRSADISTEKSVEKSARSSHFNESDSSAPSKSEKSANFEDHATEQVTLGHEDGTQVEKDNQQKEEKDAQYSTEQKSIPTPKTDESSSPSASSLENQLKAKEGGENQKMEESSAQLVPSNNSSRSSSFSVSQALDALTGMDDSTQVAVNSVFSVIEDVITQLEGNRDDSDAIDDKVKIGDKDTDPESESYLQQKDNGENNFTTESKVLGNHSVSNLSTDKKDEVRVFDNNRDDIQHYVTRLPRNSLYDHYVKSYLFSNMKSDKLLDVDAATALFLDYVPEEGQWKLLEQSGDGKIYVDDAISHECIDKNVKSPLPSDVECKDDIIEPPYVLLDAERDGYPVGEYKKIGEAKERLEVSGDASVVLIQLVKENILNSLKVEVCRRITATDMEDIAHMLKKELEEVANTIALAVVHDKQHIISWDGEKFVGLGNLQAEHILDAISSAVEGTRYMKEVIPVGIVVGSSLASLRKKFSIAAADSSESTDVVRDQISESRKGYHLQADRIFSDEMPLGKVNQTNEFYSEDEAYVVKDVSSSLRSDTVMVGAVTAALGASALLVHQQGTYGDGLEGSTTSSMSLNTKDNHQEPGKLEVETSKSSDHNIVTSLAEKAMSVASPVVPTKEGGEVDQERLVALLADLGQKGGILKLVGKFALLWGGIRGAMSLTGKLISFLHLAERPLFQRILGFVSMVLVLWTPIVVPLLPTLVQNWAEHNSSKFAELACIMGLYSSIMILIVLWGKRIRGYEDPLQKYGLELTSAKQIPNFLCGLIGGVMLVLLIQSTNVFIGFVSISWPMIPTSADAATLLKLSGEVLRFVGQGLLTTIAVALVEELLFRSWLPAEIAADLGDNQGIILSGLAFSLCQWSLKAIPGLWLLSLGLAGVRQRCQGSLSVPIGLRTGIMASSFVLKEGGFLIYQPTYPLWLSGGDPFQPFSSIVGLAVASLLAVVLYPRIPQISEGTIKE